MSAPKKRQHRATGRTGGEGTRRQPARGNPPNAGEPDAAAERYVPDTARAGRELGLEQWIPLDEAIRRTEHWRRSPATPATRPTHDQSIRLHRQRLADWGVHHVFLLPGGGAMHLNDSFASEPRIRSSAITTSRLRRWPPKATREYPGKTGVVNVTTGPGGINALNGVFGAWTDSVPMLVDLRPGEARNLHGDHGTCRGSASWATRKSTSSAWSAGSPSTRFWWTTRRRIRYHLERAWYLATSGRPGPCWLDIPVDVQSACVIEHGARAATIRRKTRPWDAKTVAQQCREIDRPPGRRGASGDHGRHRHPRRRRARRIPRSGAAPGIPVTTAWTHDMIATDDPLFCGRPGTIGERAGNFTVQNADALLVLGSRLNIRQMSYNWQSFARHAFMIQVDVDAAELAKPTVRPDLPIHCDLKVFLREMLRQLPDICPTGAERHEDWLAWCRERVAAIRWCRSKQRPQTSRSIHITSSTRCSPNSAEDDVVVCGNATACIVPYQTARLQAASA